MANYYTRTVITEPVLLTDELESVLSARGATTYPEGEPETVLDGIVNERPPLRRYSVVFPEGWTEPCDDVDEFLIDYACWDEEDVENASPEVRRLVLASEPDILREILKLNPDQGQIEMQAGWSCSKMRLDGFGGSGLIVNRKGYLYITTSNWEEDEDGVLQPRSAFVYWEPEPAAT